MKIRVLVVLWVTELGFSSAAMADTREDVLTRASRCLPIVEERRFLECFYAAAQPLRAALGLPPAPQADAYTALLSTPAREAAAPGRPAATPPPRDDRSWITSFVVGTPVRVPPDQFGLKAARPGPGLNVDHITAKMANYDRSNGRFVVTLANGQVWRQVSDSAGSAGWTKPASAYTVAITEGAFDSFNMQVSGSGSVFKVERLR